MSLEDLVELASVIRVERRPLTKTEKHLRWVRNNRAKWNKYRREWRRKRRKQGLPVT